MLNVSTPLPRCTEIEALFILGNEENKSATLNIRSVKCRDQQPDPPPNVEPVDATLAAAPAAAASVHTTTAAPSSPASPAASVMEQRRDVCSRLPHMPETDGSNGPPPVSIRYTVSVVSPVAQTADPILDTPLPPNTKPVTPPVTKAHETSWLETEGLDHINGSLCDKEWGVKASNGLVLSPSNKEASAGMSCLDFFMLVFMPNRLLKIFQLTNTP